MLYEFGCYNENYINIYIDYPRVFDVNVFTILK